MPLLQTEFESSIFEFELLNVNNCIIKLNLNHIIWICRVKFESLHWKAESEDYILILNLLVWKNQLSIYFHFQFSHFKFGSQNSNSVLAIQFQFTVSNIRAVEEEQSSAHNQDSSWPISTYVFTDVIYRCWLFATRHETEEVEMGWPLGC